MRFVVTASTPSRRITRGTAPSTACTVWRDRPWRGSRRIRSWLVVLIRSTLAARVGTSAKEAWLEVVLLADPPGERIVRPPDTIPSAQDAALRVNLAISRSVLARATMVVIVAEGSICPVVEHQQLPFQTRSRGAHRRVH